MIVTRSVVFGLLSQKESGLAHPGMTMDLLVYSIQSGVCNEQGGRVKGLDQQRKREAKYQKKKEEPLKLKYTKESQVGNLSPPSPIPSSPQPAP